MGEQMNTRLQAMTGEEVSRSIRENGIKKTNGKRNRGPVTQKQSEMRTHTANGTKAEGAERREH